MLGVLAALTLLALAYLRGRVTGIDGAARIGLPVAALALAAASVPFIVEGRFGILGTGFNVDMSQHLFAADWLSRPLAARPDLLAQGYPMGPHALAAGFSELSGGNLVQAFSGVTIVAPVAASLASLAVLGSLPARAAVPAAVLVGFPYLVASYVAQGSFKEVWIATIVLAFALWLRSLVDEEASGPRSPWTATVPGAALAAGAIYVYSAPGLAWLIGAAGAWGALEVTLAWRRGEAAGPWLRPRLLAVLAGALLTAAAIAPEAGRMLEFRGNVSSVAGGELVEVERSRPVAGGAPALASADARGGGGLDFDDNLGNLFGDLSPLEAAGVWPTGDFRVQPGDGSTPAVFFWLGALLALAAIAAGARRLAAGPAADRALLAALAAAALIAAGGYALSTPYTTAKLLQVIAPLAALVAVAGLLRPSPDRRLLALGAAYLAAAGLSSALALANAPVGPEDYSSGLAKLRPKVERRSALVLARPALLADKHGRDYLGWELRGARPLCIEPDDSAIAEAGRAPAGIRWVITTAGRSEAPYPGFELWEKRGKVTLWQGPKQRSSPPGFDPEDPTRCELASRPDRGAAAGPG